MPDHPRLYVLGCFARYVTVYAQQVRAFNLVDTLARSGYLRERSEVAVIGGGIAGLTAAAAFAVRGVRRVAVFEKLGNTMRIQRGTDKRFIHPHIYDWPAATVARDAGHDLLDWTAGRAGEVIAELDRQWDRLRGQYPALEAPRLDCQGIEVLPEGPRWVVHVGGAPAGTFDVVVLAVGFGRDSLDATESYWTDTSLDGLEAESGGTWFLSGYGDGGLTDLMRLCIMDFRHQDVLETIDQATREKVGSLLLAVEQAGRSPAELAEVLLRAARLVKPDLDGSKLRKRKLGRVLLNCPSETELFSGRSSVLNRLIVAYLLIDGRFDLFKGGGRIELPLGKTADGRPLVRFENGREPFPVDRVILRHGPDSALKADFPEIYARCRNLEKIWKSARQHEDWTRQPLYSSGDFKPGLQPWLRLDFGGKIGCVVITGSTAPAGRTQRQRVADAMQILKRRSTMREVEPQAVDVSATQAFSSPAAYEWTVRALCDSDIAVFDITGFESAVMLLLGIRAAVRRGVTITISQHPYPGRVLPFNLAALNPIPFGEDDLKPIADAMETGLASLEAQADAYLDLPVFDAVRYLGKDYKPVTPDKQILVLRWFDEQYGVQVRPVIQAKVVQAIGEGTKVLTTLDSSSPQLVNQRLYAAIRRTQLCLADWTGWRPNVFFEIGVRLAVNSADPLHLICREPPPGWNEEISGWLDKPDPSAEVLKRFFQPVEFTFSDYSETLEGILEPRPQGMLSPGRTYQVILESIPRGLEPGGQAVDEMLLHQAGRIAGPPGPEEGDFPLLYSEVLAEQARRSSVEMLLAAWHYLDRRDAGGGKGMVERVRAKELKTNDPGVARLRKVGQELSGRLRNSSSAEHKRIRSEILIALAALTDEEEESRG